MRIGFDATALPDRPVGAGRYIIRLVRALSALEIRARAGGLCPGQPAGLIDTPALENVHWVETPAISPARRLVWEQTTLPRLARRHGLDLLHSPHYTRPLELGCASVVTFHDMTFFLYPELHTRAKRLFFPWMMRFSARQAQAIIADSESTRRDAMRILHIPAEKIFTVPLGIGEEFRRITDPALLEDCRRRYNLPREFMLYVGLVEPRKNLPLLLEAYAAPGAAAEAPRRWWWWGALAGCLKTCCDRSRHCTCKTRCSLPDISPTQTCRWFIIWHKACSILRGTRALASRLWKPWPAARR